MIKICPRCQMIYCVDANRLMGWGASYIIIDESCLIDDEASAKNVGL